jgi:hypothetical protein
MVSESTLLFSLHSTFRIELSEAQWPGIPLRIFGKRGKIQALCFQTFKPQEKCTVKLNPVK